MAFSLTRPWTNADLATLIGSVEDDRNWRLVVDRSGEVSLLDASANETPYDALHCYFETWCWGTGHAGTDAAADAGHVSRVADALRENWPVLQGDEFIDH